MQRPLESAQYTSYAFQQVLDDHRVLASIGSVGDAYDNAMAESFVDTFKTELIKDRVWRTRTQLELATVEYVGWFNQARLHESLRDRPPAEIEALYAAQAPISPDGSVADPAPRAANGPTAPRVIDREALERPNGADRAIAALIPALTEPQDPANDEHAAGGSLHSLYELASLTAGDDPTTIT